MGKNKKGFTLIELVVVMAIIAVLAALIVGSITLARQAQRNTVRTSDAKTFQLALESYFSSNKSYPGTVNTSSDVYSTSSNVRPLLAAYLPLATMSGDPKGDSNRIIYCPLSTSTYVLYVQTEPTAAAAPTANCNGGAAPAGAIDLSVK